MNEKFWEQEYLTLLKEHKLLQSEHNVLLQVHAKVIDDCLEKRQKLNKSFNNIREDYNKLLEREQNKGWNE